MASLLQSLCKLGSEHVAAAHTLYALHDAGTHVTLLQLALPCIEVVDGEVCHMPVGIDGSDDLGVLGGLHSQRCASVERFLCRQDACSPVGERGELHGILIGFGARVDEEELVILVAACLAQPLCQLFLKAVDDRVAVEAKPGQLLLQHLHIVRVAVSDADDSMPAIQIQVFLTLVVPHLATFSLDNVDVVERIYVK